MTGIVGQDAQIAAFLSAAGNERLHHAWLLTGAEGVGKGRFARAAAAALLAHAARGLPGGPASLDVPNEHPTTRLIEAGSHPDLILLERMQNEKTGDLTRSISVDQVRQLSGKFALAPSQANRRIVIVDAAEDMERSAANALLKSLEEPPAHTLFLLVSHMPGRLLPTIRSRCTILRFSGLADEAMTSLLRTHLPDAEPQELAALVKIGEGSLGRALGFAGLDIADIDANLASIAQTGDPSLATRSALATKLSAKSAQRRYEAFLKRVPNYIAHEARNRHGQSLANALQSWEAAHSLSQSAIQLSLTPQSVVFALAGHVAALALSPGNAKA